MSTYSNRMEQSPEAAAVLVTPRSGVVFQTPDGLLTSGVAVRRDHPLAIANRAMFILAGEGANELAKPKAKKKAKAKAERFISNDEAGD